MPFEILTFPIENSHWTCVGRQSPANDSLDTGDCGDLLMVERNRSDGSSVVVLIDVMGHGPKAARIAQWLQQSLETEPGFWNQPLEELLEMLHGIMRNIASETFTFACGFFVELKSRETVPNVALINAATPFPYVKLDNRWREVTFPTVGTLGIERDGEWTLHCHQLDLCQSDEIVICSDGITERVTLAQPDQDTAQLVCDLLSSEFSESLLVERLANLWDRLAAAAGAHWLKDDATLARMRVTGNGRSPG